jgi:hypothetical protein
VACHQCWGQRENRNPSDRATLPVSCPQRRGGTLVSPNFFTNAPVSQLKHLRPFHSPARDSPKESLTVESNPFITDAFAGCSAVPMRWSEDAVVRSPGLGWVPRRFWDRFTIRRRGGAAGIRQLVKHQPINPMPAKGFLFHIGLGPAFEAQKPFTI